MDPVAVQTVVQTLGVPVAVMLGMAYGVLRVARWLAPRADDVIQTHKQFVTDISHSVVQINERIDGVHDDVRAIRDQTRK